MPGACYSARPVQRLARAVRGVSRAGRRRVSLAKVAKRTVSDIPINGELRTKFKDLYNREWLYELHGHQTPAAVRAQTIRREGGMSARRPEFEPHNRSRIE